MKVFKVFLTIFLFTGAPCFALTSETFAGSDINEIKAGISKYILTRGGRINHGDSYDSSAFQAVEQIRTGKESYTLVYTFNLISAGNCTRLDLKASKSALGAAVPLSSMEEQKIMDAIASSIRGRFLYGLGFDFAYYDSPNGRIKAPKGREAGIKLTAVKYDALKQGLEIGDLITEINGISLNKIPLEEFAVILHAKSMADRVTLTYKRGQTTGKVTLSPRLNSTKTF